MLLRDGLEALRRRWVVVLVGLIIVAAGGLGVFMLVGPRHEATATAVLLPPSTTSVRHADDYTVGNPLFYLSGLTQPRDLVINRLRSGNVEAEFERLHPGVTYDVSADSRSSGPVIVVTTSARTEAAALGALADLNEQVTATMTDIQQALNIEPAARITVFQVTNDRQSTIDRAAQLRAGIATGGGLAVGVVLLVALLEGLARPTRVT